MAHLSAENILESDLEQRAMTAMHSAACGDSSATVELLRLMRPAIAQTVRRVLGSSHPDVDDSIQQALLALLAALPAFRGECKPATYARQIAARTALRSQLQLHRRYRHQKEFHRLQDDLETAPPPQEQRVEHRRDLLCELLADIPREQAQALTHRAVLGLTLEEVARLSGAPINTVRSRVRMAREALRSRLRARPSVLEELSPA